jgi:hypothetical protein
VRAGADGRAKLVVKARGAAMQHLPLPLTLPVTAQGQASDGGCWEASYLGTGVQQNDASRFVGFGAP